MVSKTSTLPDNLDELKGKVISLQESNNHFEVENNILREQVRLLRAQLYGRKTEKNEAGQEVLRNCFLMKRKSIHLPRRR